MDPNLLELKEYKSFTGPGGSQKVFTYVQVSAALQFIACVLGVTALYPEQSNCLLALFTGMPLFCLQPTSFGKTFAFWGLPLLYEYLFNVLDPTTARFNPVMIILSPLNALMIKQVQDLNVKLQQYNDSHPQVPIPWLATHISSEQADSTVFGIVKRRGTRFALLYSGPERYLKDKNSPYRLLLTQYGGRLIAIIMDEAHSILEWMHEFRPAFGLLGDMRALVPLIPWGLYSATLTPGDRKILIRLLDFHAHALSIGVFSRPNIFLDLLTLDDPSDIDQMVKPLLEILSEKKGQRSIVYVNKTLMNQITVVLGDAVGQYDARTRGALLIDYYHSGISKQRKAAIPADWMSVDGKKECLCSTNALGMGLDMRKFILCLIWASVRPCGNGPKNKGD